MRDLEREIRLSLRRRVLGVHPLATVTIPLLWPQAITVVQLPTDATLLRCERGDNLFKARIAAQRIPIRVKFEKAIAEGVRNALHCRDLFDGGIFFTSPGVDLRQVNGQVRAVDSFFKGRQQLSATMPLEQCILL